MEGRHLPPTTPTTPPHKGGKTNCPARVHRPGPAPVVAVVATAAAALVRAAGAAAEVVAAAAAGNKGRAADEGGWYGRWWYIDTSPGYLAPSRPPPTPPTIQYAARLGVHSQLITSPALIKAIN